MEKKYEHFVDSMDFTPGKNLIWNFLDCKSCHKESQHNGSLHSTLVAKFKLCGTCEKELDNLRKDK